MHPHTIHSLWFDVRANTNSCTSLEWRVIQRWHAVDMLFLSHGPFTAHDGGLLDAICGSCYTVSLVFPLFCLVHRIHLFCLFHCLDHYSVHFSANFTTSTLLLYAHSLHNLRLRSNHSSCSNPLKYSQTFSFKLNSLLHCAWMNQHSSYVASICPWWRLSTPPQIPQ